jgi:O-antigen ligase
MFLSAAFAWTALRKAGIDLEDWNITVLALAVTAAVLLPRSDAPPLRRRFAWPLILLPVWVFFQLVPLPANVAGLLSPARAALASAAGQSHGIPLSAFPAQTFTDWMRLMGGLLVFLIVRELAWHYSDRRTPWIVIVPLIVAACLEAALGIIQFYTGAVAAEGAHGTYGSRDHFAGLMEMALPFPVMYGVSLLRRKRSRFETPLRPALAASACFAAAALLLLGSIQSLSRMGFIAALVSLAVLGLCILPDKRWLLCLPPAALLLFIYLPPNELIARFAGMSSLDKVTAEDRLEIWRETLPMAAAYPVTGCGLGAFEYAFMPYKRSTPLLTDNYAHNDYLQYFVELGAPAFCLGSIFVAGLIAAAIHDARRQPSFPRRCLAIACLASMCALLLHSLVDFNSYIPGNTFAFAWVAGMAAALRFSA